MQPSPGDLLQWPNLVGIVCVIRLDDLLVMSLAT
jgi:hypothetical protein